MPRVAQQDDVDIIELDSSPDLRPQTRATTSRQVNRTGKGKKRARPIPATDIIELSDSDLDGDAVSLPRSRGRRPQPPPAPAGPVAGPSRVAQMPLFLPDLDDAVEVDRPKSPSAKSTNSGVSSDMRRGMARLHLDQAPPPVVAPAQPVARPPEPPAAPVIVGPNAMGVDLTVDDGPARLDAYVAQVLEIVPDVLPEHVRMLVEQNEPTYEGQVVERILHSLFELPNYPKADPQGKGKRKREDDDQGREAKNVKVDYASKNRQPPGPMYAIQALERLYTDFPTIPVAHVRATFHSHNSLYAPTYLRLHDEVNSPNPPFRLKSSAVKRQPKGKMKPQEELEEEVAFIKNKFAADPSSAAAPEATSSAAAASVEVDPEDGGIECGCCFSSYAFDTMIQCPDAHLFCKDCMSSYAEGLLGAHDANIVCMDQTGCKLLFPASELRRFLTPKLLALYERVKQRKEIEAAGLEGLEECPHCDYKVVIENEQERLFRCQNEECMAVTCRQCKKPDHLPKSCKEVEDDKKLDGRHAIEEAMTKALMRNCPKCQKAFIKEHGCNKMICPNCRTMSCYVCRKVILGYEHFNNPPPYNGRKDPNKCELWDSVEKRHSDEVTAAAKKATEEYKRAHPEVTEEDLKVDLPPAPVAGPSNAPVPGMLPRAVPPPLPFVFFGNQPIDPGPAFFMPPPPPAPPHFGQAGVDVGGFVGLPHEIARQRLMEQERLLVEVRAAERQAALEVRRRRVAAARAVVPPVRAAVPPVRAAVPPVRAAVPPVQVAGALYGAQGRRGVARPIANPPPAVPPPPPVVAGRPGAKRARARR